MVPQISLTHPTVLLFLCRAECALPMLTPNFLRSVANNATKQGTYLHTAAQHCMESIGALAACSDAGARAEVFVALNRNGGNAYARLLNKSRGAQDSDHDAEKLVDKLVKEFDELKGDEALSRRKWILSQLAATIKQKQNGPAVAKQVIDFLIEKGLFGGVNSAEEGGDGLRVQCASQFITTLDWLVRPRTQDRKDTADPDILGQTMTHIEERVAAGAELATPPTDASEKAGEVLSTLRTSLQEQLSATANESSEAHRQLDALRQLVCFLELHALINPDNADADLASDLARVFDDKFGQAASKQAGDDGVHWADALVDILLSILAANQVPFPSAPLRDAAERVFRAFAADVSATGIQDLLAVVERPLDQKEGEDEDDGDEDGSEEDDGEDNDAAEDDSDSHAGSDDEASDEGSDASSDEVSIRVPKRRKLVTETLVMRTIEHPLYYAWLLQDISDAEAGDDPMEATDEQMFKMDAMLAATFATMRSSRDNKRARQDAINFKLRSLACLEAYVKKVPEGPLLLRMPAPLLTALTGANKSGGDRVLAERIAAVIKARLSKCKAHAEGDEDAEEMKAQLRRALFLASRAEDKLVEDAATAAYCFLQRSLYDSDLKDVQASAQESAATALADFFDKKKTRLGRPFFQQLFTRAPSVAAGALPTLLTFCASARNEFKQQEAYWMVGVAVKAADSRVAQALKEANAAMAAMVETALGGAIAKPARRAEAVKTVCSVAQTLSSKGSSLLEVLGAKLGKKVSAAVKKAEAEHENDPHIARLAAILAGKETKAAGKRKGRPEAQAKKPSKKK